MTEKRFNWDTIDRDVIFYDNGAMIDYDDVVDLLNSLYDENEQLKQSHKEILKDLEVTTFDRELLQKENEELNIRIDRLKEVIRAEPFARAEGEITRVKTDEFIRICKENNELIKDNEQLKQEKDELFLFFMEHYDQLEDELIEIEIKLEERIKELEKENEQLKYEVNSLMEDLGYIDAELEELEDIDKNVIE